MTKETLRTDHAHLVLVVKRSDKGASSLTENALGDHDFTSVLSEEYTKRTYVFRSMLLCLSFDHAGILVPSRFAG